MFMFMFLFTVTASILFLFGFCFAYWKTQNFAAPLVVAACMASLGLLLGEVFLLLQALGLGITVAVAAVASLGCRGVSLCAVVATVGAYAVIFFLHMNEEHEEWQKAREKYPLVSLKDRLAYEQKNLQARAGLSPTKATPETWNRLEEIESGRMIFLVDRPTALEIAHAGVVRQFINSPGFGAARNLRRPGPKETDFRVMNDAIPPSRSYQSLRIAEGTETPYQPLNATADPADPRHVPAGLWNVHRDGVISFVDRQSLGYVKNIDQIAGFMPHAFRESPPSWAERTGTTYSFTRLELIGIMQHDEPRAYVSDVLPSMELAGQHPTRRLDDFETKALAALREGQDLYLQRGESTIHMLGSLRAGKQCLKCHDVERGDLLGAFTYVLTKGK